MDYTKNYHLPQWVEDDRIRRTDFNDAMASNENGLTEGGTDRAALHDALVRQARNQWRQLAVLTDAPWQEGSFRQGFARMEKTYVGDLVQFEGQDAKMVQLTGERLWTANGDKVLRFEDIVTQKLSGISYEKGTDTCAFTFTMPAAGYLQYFFVRGHYDGNQEHLADGAAALRIYNDETGELLEERETFVGGKTWQPNTVGIGTFRNDMYRIFHAKTRYRIELQLHELLIPCSFNFGAADGDPLVFSGCNQETVSFTRRLRSERESRCGIVLVRYEDWNCTDPVSVRCLGETFAPCKVRDVTFKGSAVKEAEFRIDRTIPTDCTFNLDIHCDKYGDFTLYDWGAALI